MSFNKHHFSFILIMAFIASQPSFAEKHAANKKQPEKQQSQTKPEQSQENKQPEQKAEQSNGQPAEQPLNIAGFKSNEEIISYTIGASVGRNFKKDGISINTKLFTQGLNDALTGDNLKMTEKEFKSVLAGFQTEIRRKMAVNQKERSIQNQQKADAFLAENGKKQGIVTLPSGLQYKELKAGNGAKPVESDIVEVHYRGTLLDGKEFDASPEGKTVNLKLAQLIPGWKEAITLMPVGAKWQLFVPGKLAYGERGVGNEIGPNELLIFEVELVGINTTKQQQ